ncbi:MAG: phosphate acyltransferase PlsX [bacterium]
MSIRVAIDAMGGDHAPIEIIKGAIIAAKEYNIALQLVGQTDKIEAELNKYNTNGLDIKITRADEIIEMDEAPGTAIRRKKNSSIVVAVDAVAKNESQALVAAGSTGAAMAASLFGLGRLPGIDRPAIAVILPTMLKPAVMLDAGANSSCEPHMLAQFATMGSIFSASILGVKNPRVGVLNIGGESSKGNTLTQNTYKLLAKQTHINFIGNVEGRELFMGICDVVVCDGFVGNVTLKVAEGVANMIVKMLKDELNSSVLAKIGAAIAKPALLKLKKKSNYEEYGGALLIGIKGICVIAHGGSKANAIKNAIRVAKESVEADINGKIANMYELNKI